jgi:hypothetical protein
MEGLDNMAALLTVIQTCKVQGKPALDFFLQALIDPTELTLVPPQTQLFCITKCCNCLNKDPKKVNHSRY